MADNLALAFKNYSFRYEGASSWVLKDINLELYYGEVTLLYGMSGGGKSTLLNSMNGIIPHTVKGEQTGDIYLNGQHLFHQHPSEVARFIGSVLQNADSQIIHHYVEDEIAFGCENIGLDSSVIESKIREACQFIGLNPRMQTKTLSGGLKQKLMMATTLAMGQKLLILDEPLANLDLASAKQLLEQLKYLASKGYGILVVEHRVDMVLPYADKIYALEQGALQKSSATEERLIRTMAQIKGTHEACITNEAEILFSLNNIKFKVRDDEILKGVFLDIYKNERIVILGENGCGKTTLLKLIAKMIRPSEGVYQQNLEKRIKKKPGSQWFKKLGFVYQNPNYQLFMPSVATEILYSAQSDKLGLQMIQDFSFQEIKEQHPQSLSEGQKRRLTIATILAMNPEVLLLDEPTVGQDYHGLNQLIERLNAIHQQKKMTMITITHDFRCAQALGDRIIWMKEGRIYKVGGPELAEEYAILTKVT